MKAGSKPKKVFVRVLCHAGESARFQAKWNGSVRCGTTARREELGDVLGLLAAFIVSL
jgi:hypothetical protein